MKKIFIIITITIFLFGCTKEENSNNIVNEKIDEEIIEEVKEEKYVDENNTDIGIYLYQNGKYNLVNEYKTSFKDNSDIVIFSIYPSKDEYIDGYNYINNLYDTYKSLDNYNSLKVGFNLKYTLSSGEEISYNILDPNTALNYDIGHILAWLYDDYKHRYDSWYSHIEQDEFNNDDTLITSIKLYNNNNNNTLDISSKIHFTVFTYDGEDDFDSNGEYRGNSSYSIDICDINRTC